jgi:hypothetical protein
MNALPECYDSFAVTNGRSWRVSCSADRTNRWEASCQRTAEMVEPAERHRVTACVSRLGPAALVALILGCTSWSRLSDNQPVPARGAVQVWSAGEDIVLRDPRRLGDSLVGRRPLPDTTRRAVALSDIDSVRTQASDPGKMLIVGTGGN